jgi:outer membrane protein assembly factor BamB
LDGAPANGLVYVGSSGNVFGYDARGCAPPPCYPIWLTEPAGDEISSSPAIANGMVFVGSADGRIYAYAAVNCGEIFLCPPVWKSLATGSTINSSPAVANGVVYAASFDGILYALRASGCGASECAPSWHSTPTPYIWSSPAVVNGIVYVTSLDKKLYAYGLSEDGVTVVGR